jgi:2-polyprenyl-3-methyl-5-hydroxy-6-metoxy-1,4-benzoquinol methylase
VLHPDHETILEAVRARWSEHAPFLDRVAAACEPALVETAGIVAGKILALAGDALDRHADGYRWMCQMVLDEELEFRRTGRYRYSRFEEVADRVYGDLAVMAPYMEGLLLSQVLWVNHLRVLDFYRRRFLPLVAGGAHLEVGPGHGLLLALAAQAGARSLTGWDVSVASLDKTRAALATLGVRTGLTLELHDVHAPASGTFDTIVFSEVLEHLEDPLGALRALRERLGPGGHVYVNAPVNSPAIDHIHLLRSPEELVALVQRAGLVVGETCIAPVTGHTEARARKQGLAISCAVVAHA